MSWITEIFDRLNLRQLKLLLWFLDGEEKYVEANGVRFEWDDGYIVMSGPEFESSATSKRRITGDGFRSELRSQIGRLAHEEARS